jgi:Co/Zn/Cd efflux system component
MTAMDACCSAHPVHERQRRALRLVLWINAAMFLAELVAGVVAHSTSHRPIGLNERRREAA